MGASISLIKTLALPAAISLALYLLLSYAIIPTWQRYRGRYSHYLPLESITERTSDFRGRVTNVLYSVFIPSTWRSRLNDGRLTSSTPDDSDDFDIEDGEELYEVDESRREAISLDARRHPDLDRRLSRDLEEGFRDESDDENSTRDTRR